MTGSPHGRPMVNGLPSHRIGRATFENFEIYVMDTDGGNQQKLTNHRGDDRSPSWSLDGERITFSSRRDGNLEIYVMDAEWGKSAKPYQ